MLLDVSMSLDPTLVDLGAAIRRGGERAAARGPLRAGLDTHLTNVYAKLGISSRRDLAAALGMSKAAG